jgi:signal transduction histidine kinase
MTSGDFNLESELTSARGAIDLLRTQAQAGQIDAFFMKKLDDIRTLLDRLIAQRREHPDVERFSRLYEVSRVIGSSLDLEEVLNSVMDAIIALTEAERGFLMLLNDDGQLAVQIARNFDQETLSSSDIAFSRTITKQVFETGEPVITTNASEDPRYAGQASIVAHQLRSVMAAPLRVRGTYIGVVYVDNRVRTALFQKADLELLEAFAGQAAVAIENARLFEETDQKLTQRLEELQTLQWIDRQLNETLDVSKAMDLTVDWALRMCRAQSASLAMLNPTRDRLVVMSHAGEEEGLQGQNQTIDLAHPLIRRVFETNQAALQLSPEGTPEPESLFCVPIRRENRIVGVIVVYARRENAFNEDAQALVARMADRAAIAIENGRLYDELKRANQAKSEFVGTVAHELKVPMTGISGYADLLLQFGNLDQRSQDFAMRIKGNVNRMQTLVEDLSDISRIESGNLRVEITDVNLREVIDEAKASTIAQIEERQHRLIEEVSDNLPTVRADPARTTQILVNILSNAYKYTPNGGTIVIRTSQQNGHILVSIKDTGVGMSPEELEKLGTKFWRSGNDHVLKQRGTGLGFSITRHLIDLMHCTLNIESEVGKGSTVTVGIPISKG